MAEVVAAKYLLLGTEGVDSMGTARIAAQEADACTQTTTEILRVAQNDGFWGEGVDSGGTANRGSGSGRLHERQLLRFCASRRMTGRVGMTAVWDWWSLGA